jgi:hypothetical protein
VERKKKTKMKNRRRKKREMKTNRGETAKKERKGKRMDLG